MPDYKAYFGPTRDDEGNYPRLTSLNELLSALMGGTVSGSGENGNPGAIAGQGRPEFAGSGQGGLPAWLNQPGRGTESGLFMAENASRFGQLLSALTGVPGLSYLGRSIGNNYIDNNVFQSDAPPDPVSAELNANATPNHLIGEGMSSARDVGPVRYDWGIVPVFNGRGQALQRRLKPSDVQRG